MIRRTLRGGLWLGLLVGLVLLVARLVRTRTSAPPTIDLRTPGDSPPPVPEAWPTLQTPAAAEAPAAVATEPAEAPAPVATEAVATEAVASEPVAAAKTTLPPWVAPDNGICPATHPVKAKLSSGIFQVAGNAMYERTRPDRCYRTPEAAAEDGLRPAKR